MTARLELELKLALLESVYRGLMMIACAVKKYRDALEAMGKDETVKVTEIA